MNERNTERWPKRNKRTYVRSYVRRSGNESGKEKKKKTTTTTTTTMVKKETICILTWCMATNTGA